MVQNVSQIKSGITINVDASAECWCEKDVWNPATCICKNGKYLANIIDVSVITCDEIINAEAKSYDEETKTVTTNFNEKKQSIFYLLFY